MANKTIQELRDFVIKQMPSNSELQVKPFRTFFNYLLDRLEGIPDATGFNELLNKIFGTTDLNSIDYQAIFGRQFSGTNLIQYLLFLKDNKADLVNGKVPIAQIPDLTTYFRVGKVETTPSTVKLKLRLDQFNVSSPNLLSVYGVVRTETSESLFTYTPVTEGKIKLLAIYGLIDLDSDVDNEQIFFLAEGDEGIEAPEPDLPEGAVLIKYITVTSETQIQSGEEEDQLIRYTYEDYWRNMVINNNSGALISSQESGSIKIYINPGVTTPKIYGIGSKFQRHAWDGRMLLLYNKSNVPVLLESRAPIPPYNESVTRTFISDYTMAPGEFTFIKIDGGRVHVLPFGGSGGTLPSGGGEWDFEDELPILPEDPELPGG